MDFVKNSNALDEWNSRLARAAVLVERGAECAMCGGTGAWPAFKGLRICVPCGGTGESSHVHGVPERRI